MFSKKNQLCKWHRCGEKRFHHTMEEWTVHQQYAKADIPTVSEEVRMVNNVVPDPVQAREYIESGAMPAGYTGTPHSVTYDRAPVSRTQAIWIGVSIATTIAVWAMIMKVVWF